MLTDMQKSLHLLYGHWGVDGSELLKGNQQFFKIYIVGQLTIPISLDIQVTAKQWFRKCSKQGVVIGYIAQKIGRSVSFWFR